MKKIFILSLLALGLVGCESYSNAPYGGTLGNYGFTYDLNTTPSPPSPFVDTSYRPLTAFDLAAPMVVVVTNQPPPPRVIYQQEPPIGQTIYSGQTPTRSVATTHAPVVNESAGAQPNQVGTTVAPTVAAPGYPGYYGEGGSAVAFPGTNGTNNGEVATNLPASNSINGTVTNGFVTQTNPVIGEPAGTQLHTNRPYGEPPVPPQAATNRILLVPNNPQTTPVQPQQTPAPVLPRTVQPQTPVQPAVRPAPVQRPAIQAAPPASAPRNPPAQTTP